MRILVLRTDRPLGDVARRLLEAPPAEHEVTVLDLSSEAPAYDRIVDAIATHDKVISW